MLAYNVRCVCTGPFDALQVREQALPWPIRSMALSLPGQFVPWNFRSWPVHSVEFLLPGMKVLGNFLFLNFRSPELSLP